MIKRARIIKTYLMIMTLPAISGVFFVVKYNDWPALVVLMFLSAVLPGIIGGLVAGEPGSNATRYTYIKDSTKLFNQGKLLNVELMHGNKTLEDAQEEHKRDIERMGGHKRIFINFFCIPYLFIFTLAVTIFGWVSFFIH